MLTRLIAKSLAQSTICSIRNNCVYHERMHPMPSKGANRKPTIEDYVSESGGQPGNSRRAVFPIYCRSAKPILLVK